MKKRPVYVSLMHRLFGTRRTPMNADRAREILDKNKVYTEITYAKPLKEWRYGTNRPS